MASKLVGVSVQVHILPPPPSALPALFQAESAKQVTGRSRPLASKECSLDPSITRELARNPDPPGSSRIR